MQQRCPRRHPGRTARLASALLIALSLTVLSGCHTLRFEVADAPHESVVHHQKSFFVAGLFPRQKQVDVSTFCPYGVSEVREQTTLADGLLSVLTVSIWTPRSSWYYCLSADDVDRNPWTVEEL